MAIFVKSTMKCVMCPKEFDTFTGMENVTIHVEYSDGACMIPLCKDCSIKVRVFIGLDEEGYIKTLIRRRKNKK